MKSQRLQATTIDHENRGMRLIQRPAVRMPMIVVTTQIDARQIDVRTKASATKLVDGLGSSAAGTTGDGVGGDQHAAEDPAPEGHGRGPGKATVRAPTWSDAT